MGERDINDIHRTEGLDAARAHHDNVKPFDRTKRLCEETLAAFDRWLKLRSRTPVLAALGAAAANYLDGDPCWLGIVGPPSTSKTEILNSLSRLPDVKQSGPLTQASLLSGTGKKERDPGTKGGLLREIGSFGIITVKDFGSILSMHTETRAELLAAVREIGDGEWTRRIGVGGGKELHWKGKVGLLFGVTGAIDNYHAVVSSLGDRWLLTRMAPVKDQFAKALEHRGAVTKTMRAELAEAVANHFAGRRQKPQDITPDEIKRLGEIVALVVRLRGAVERDRYSREIEMIYGAEGGGRVGLSLERLLAGLDVLGIERAQAFNVVKSVALDSVPPQRRWAYEFIKAAGANVSVETSVVATALGLPTVTVRRVLEDLAAYRLIKRSVQGHGKADLWAEAKWETEDE